jgi:diacylglycerol kinase (ATP)
MLRIPRKPCRIPGYLKNGQPKSIDVGKVNDSYFFCTFGFGFDALIAHRFAESKSRGLKTYVLEVLRAFIGYKGVEARFLADGEEYGGKFFSVTLSNANQFGNNAFIAPFADLQDGLLDLTVIRPFPKIAAPLIGLALFGKFIHLMPFTEIRKVKTVEIFSAAELRFHRDGDACVPDFPVQVSVLPDALSVLVPGH